MTERKSKDGKFAFEGGSRSMHHVSEGSVYGTHEGDRTEGSHAPDLRVEDIGGIYAVGSLATEAALDKPSKKLSRKEREAKEALEAHEKLIREFLAEKGLTESDLYVEE